MMKLLFNSTPRQQTAVCGRAGLIFAALLMPIQTSRGAESPAPRVEAGLPASWDGVWRGEIEVISGGKAQHRAVMELRVARISATGAKTWTIQYSGQPARPYEIRALPGAAGRLVIDEKNGNLLEANLVGQTLISAFSVGETLLTSRFENRGEEIRVEIATYQLAVRQNSAPGEAAPAASYAFGSLQRGVLRRQKSVKPVP